MQSVVHSLALTYKISPVPETTEARQSEINARLFAAALIVVPWFALRPRVMSEPSNASVLIEGAVLIALAALSTILPLRPMAMLRLPLIVGASVFVVLSILDTGQDSVYFYYWLGFGPRVTVLTGALTGVLLFFAWASRRDWIRHSAGVVRIFLILRKAIAGAVIAWAIPSLLQPMDGFLNLGDSTEKFLDEITGWAVGNFPGVHTSWVTSSMLGLPLAPLSLLDGSPETIGAAKIVLVVLYVNSLVLCVPICIAGIFARCVPRLNWWSAFALAVLVVSLSGTGESGGGAGGNTSLFQELSFLSRGLLPIALGLHVVVRLGGSAPVRPPLGFGLGLMSSFVLLNNYEYGFGAAVAVAITLAVSQSESSRPARILRMHFLGFAFGVVLVVAAGAIRGGDWIGRRLGVWLDVLGGTAREHSHNQGLFPHAFGVPTLCFALGLTAVAVGSRYFRIAQASDVNKSAVVGCLYFGIWTLASAPYFLNGGSFGFFRTQFLFVQVAILSFALFGYIDARSTSQPIRQGTEEVGQSEKSAVTLRCLPALLLCSLVAASIVQTPNGIRQWNRVQMPTESDQWHYANFAWIEPAAVVALAEQFGGVESVGWWGPYGNGIEAVTGVENLLGTTGFETMRSQSMFKLGCEPVLRSRKRFVISGADLEELLQSCGFDAVHVTSSNDGLVVYELDR
jgi:hypothetical protein